MDAVDRCKRNKRTSYETELFRKLTLKHANAGRGRSIVAQP